MNKSSQRPGPDEAREPPIQQGGQQPGHHGGVRSGVEADGDSAALQGGQHRDERHADNASQGGPRPEPHPHPDNDQRAHDPSDESRREPLPWENETKRFTKAKNAEEADALQPRN